MRRMIPVNQWEQVKKLLEHSIEKMEVSSITSMTKEQLDELQCGDIVAKVTGKQKHCYVVTYKGEGAGEGICLSYFAAGYTETVSYDRSGSNWVYNSTDVVEVPSVFYQSVTIQSTDWVSDEVELSNPLFQEGNVVIIREDASEGRANYEAVRDAELIGTASNGTLTISASTAPAGDIVILITVITSAHELE